MDQLTARVDELERGLKRVQADLEEATEDRCPECGEPEEPPEAEKDWHPNRRYQCEHCGHTWRGKP